MSRSGREPEAVAVFGRRYAEMTVKCPAQDFSAGEAGGLGDGFERRSAVLQQVSRAFDAKRLDVCGVAVRLTTRGTHTGEFMGKPATGRPFEIEAIHIYRIENERVAEHWAKRDDVALAQQIELLE